MGAQARVRAMGYAYPWVPKQGDGVYIPMGAQAGDMIHPKYYNLDKEFPDSRSFGF